MTDLNDDLNDVDGVNTLGDRIRAQRDARMQHHAAAAKTAAQAEAADQIAELHARIDKLIADNKLKT